MQGDCVVGNEHVNIISKGLSPLLQIHKIAATASETPCRLGNAG